MAKSKILSAGLAAIAIVFAAAASFLFVTSDPTPGANAQATQTASAEAPRNLRGRGAAAADRIRVIDGDTLEDMRDDITYRIVNIDTPETGSRARCSAERELGNRATATVRTLISQTRRIDVRPTGRTDRYGRTIAFVVLDGHDMGETLIAAGLARPWRGRRERWCDSSGNLIP
jgi:endonuclease YncB( thermonuclease family)